MARKSGGRRIPGLGFIPWLFTVVAIALIIVVLVAGTGPSILPDIWFLKVDVSELDIGAKLANSTFLQDLSTVSGTDLVGQEVTADSLGLGQFYTVTALGSCSHGRTETTCTPPRVGYAFDPRIDLKLDQTALSGTFSEEFVDAQQIYAKASPFIASGYIASAVLVLLAPILSTLSSRVRAAGFAAGFFSIVATALLFTASGISYYGSALKVWVAYRDNLRESGVRTTVGHLFILSWVAAVLSLLCSIVFTVRCFRREKPARPAYGARAVARSVAVTGEPQEEGPKPGLLGKIPTWNRHKYVQIEKQPAIVQTDVRGHEAAILMDDDIRREHSLDAREEDVTDAGQQRGIQMVSLAKGGKKDLNTAYEPYTSQRAP